MPGIIDGKKDIRRFASYQLPLILYAALVFIVSSISRLPEPEIEFEYLDKLAHFVEYFIFMLLTIRALANLPVALRGFFLYLSAVIISVLFAALDEYHQSFIANRKADIYDLLADSAGIMLGAVIHFFHFRRKQSRSCLSAGDQPLEKTGK